MGLVFGIVAPVFVLVGLGWAAARWKLVDQAGFRGLIGFTFHLAVPALLFLGGTTGPGGGGLAALAFFLATALVYLGTLWLARRGMRLPLGPAGMLALDASFGNTVMMGIPLITAAFGAEALAVLLAILALHSMVLLGTATVVAEVALHQGARPLRVLRATLAGLLRNPIVMAVVLAMAWRSLGLPPPVGAARRTLELLGGAGPPVALFCLGGSLAGFDARGMWRETVLATVLKLLVLPLLVWGAGRLIGLSPFETAVTVVAAAMPTGANAFLLAQRYGVGAERSGATVLVGTLLSLATVPALLALFAAR
jgi:malonate transporter and related proteins